ncbi:probable F-box protein At2g36090 [Euphorbia lathyris]|uniref:probable F-box protein At2g36090 n=1 Tax=Euphorbia lathyris TaxID=212925 RepID=UPI003313ED68
MDSPPPAPATISAVYNDILQSHILTRLDGPSLASVASASSDLHSLSADDKLWQNICTSTWPSINDSLISSVISTFPSGHRSFFSDAYPLIHHHDNSHASLDISTFPATTELISAVDIYYRDSPIFSKVERTETVTGWFNSSPFRVDLLGPKEFVPAWIQQYGEEDLRIHQMEQNVSLSWILIDPKRKRAVNLSSRKAVAVQRHWLTGEVQVRFAVILAGEGKESESEYVKCEVVVTCGGKGGEDVHVRDVSLTMEDMEGKGLNGKDSLVILREAMEKGERRKLRDGIEGKEKFRGFLEKKRERKEKLQRREKVLDWVCIATGVNCFIAFWSYMIFG